jgi:hypothetical protein
MGNLITGDVIIGYGLLSGESIFQGNPSMIGMAIDALGLFWIAKGVWQIVEEKRAGS